jgi:UDP-glucose 4-epimerase
MNVLVTGGAGYIGSHAVKRLLERGHNVTAVDNLFRGHAAAIDRLAAHAKERSLPGTLTFIQSDILDRPVIEKVLKDHAVQCVMHFAALAMVGESVLQPLLYYRNNVAGALALLEAADAAGVSKFIFSSSCATYGQPPENMIPIPESCPQDPISPYGWTKLHFEHILRDHNDACRRNNKDFGFAALRYFNVAGCDPDGVLGEDHDPETHLIPVVLQAALGLRPNIAIFGTDYPTPDGTCVRDYVHVEDLADAHVALVDLIQPGDARAYNVGIGRGYSVREIIDAVKRVTGRNIEVVEHPRRPGDPPRAFADPTRIRAEVGWKTRHNDLDGIIQTAWNWFKDHPKGYNS